MSNDAISVFIGILPEMKITDPYSPSERAKAVMNPAISAGCKAGRS